eukprot:m.200010 g.200010  ORF g.200010 m.200010 type:complete len:267 (+) comp39581_c1_seq66:997-1797(+)
MLKSSERNRREAENDDTKRTLLYAFMDVLKQLCAPNEKFCMLGPKGDKGLSGSAGQKGDYGKQGKDGQRGVGGMPGPKGGSGLIGKEGAQGMKGEKGDIGHFGQQGTKGEQGLQGVEGQKGNQGRTEYNGQKGEVGEKGVQGERGDKGTPLWPSGHECDSRNHKVLSDEWRKINVSSKGQILHCDKDLVSGWYRFSESIGGQMNTKCVPEGKRCGTHATGWLVGSHPSTVGSKVSGKVHSKPKTTIRFRTTGHTLKGNNKDFCKDR